MMSKSCFWVSTYDVHVATKCTVWQSLSANRHNTNTQAWTTHYVCMMHPHTFNDRPEALHDEEHTLFCLTHQIVQWKGRRRERTNNRRNCMVAGTSTHAHTHTQINRCRRRCKLIAHRETVCTQKQTCECEKWDICPGTGWCQQCAVQTNPITHVHVHIQVVKEAQNHDILRRLCCEIVT